MATISGRLIFNRARTTDTSSALPGIANVPIVLQDIDSRAMLAVLTDANGNYSFTNVPNGNYQIVEYYGMTPTTTTPGDFTTAAAGDLLAGGVTPPISYVPSGLVPAGATNLDCITPNTLLITVSGSNLTSQYILNGPVRYKPISTIMDSHVVLSSDNLLSTADNGTFGSLSPGTPAETIAPANPYSGIGMGFTYMQSSRPSDGYFSVMNINNDGGVGNTWWRFADHTTGNETGRMMVINGYNPGALIYKETITLMPNTYYLFSAWILNMINTPVWLAPALGVQLLDSNGDVLVEQTLRQFLSANTNTPEWVQIGSALYSQSNTELTVVFVSQGPAGSGNDYAMDDIALYEVVSMPELIPVKTCSESSAVVGNIVTYTIELPNIFDMTINNVHLQDTVPDGLTFVSGSVIVNGVSQPAADPNAGFALPDVPGGETITVTFSVTVDFIPSINPTLNTAKMTYDYAIVEGGIPFSYEIISNEVPLDISESADVYVIKESDLSVVTAGEALSYTITIANNGPSPANNVLLTDTLPTNLSNTEYSVDEGANWQPWTGSLDLGTMARDTSSQILIRGTVDRNAAKPLVNTATVSSTTDDPDLENNTSTARTRVFNPRCQAITDIIESVALQEAALSHILNAEGEKIQAMLTIDGVTAEQLLALNNTVTRLIRTVTRLETILQAKLELFSDKSC